MRGERLRACRGGPDLDPSHLGDELADGGDELTVEIEDTGDRFSPRTTSQLRRGKYSSPGGCSITFAGMVLAVSRPAGLGATSRMSLTTSPSCAASRAPAAITVNRSFSTAVLGEGSVLNLLY